MQEVIRGGRGEAEGGAEEQRAKNWLLLAKRCLILDSLSMKGLKGSWLAKTYRV